MRTPVVLGALVVTLFGCETADVVLYASEASLPPLAASCGAAPAPLAHIARLKAQPLAIDAFNLYAVATADGGDPMKDDLWRIPKGGLPPERLAKDQTRIGGLATDGLGRVFWTTGAGIDGANLEGVWRSGPPEPSAPVLIAAHRRAPGAILVVDENVVWVEENADECGPFTAIVEASTEGGPVTILQKIPLDALPRTLDILHSPAGAILFWTTADPVSRNQSSAQVNSILLPQPLPTAVGMATRVAIAGPDGGGAGAIETSTTDHIFYSGPSGIVGQAIGPDGRRAGTPSLVPTGGFVDTIEESGTKIYFIDPSTNDLMVAETATAQAPKIVASHLDPASAFQVDVACVYWADAASESVTMVDQFGR